MLKANPPRILIRRVLAIPRELVDHNQINAVVGKPA